jgi:methylthioribose-1-phosphate isomerase
MSSFKTIEWNNNKVYMIDQRKLPGVEIYNEYSTHKEVAEAIKSMVIRGAPAIGVAAAMGVAVGSLEYKGSGMQGMIIFLNSVCDTLAATRPTAVNLFWAIERMKKVINANSDKQPEDIKRILIDEANLILKEDIETCMKIGVHGSDLIKEDSSVLTHCNAGGLATGGYGTALGVIRSSIEKGKNISVISSETRPFLQGARLTTWELKKDGIPVTLITDNMVGSLMVNSRISSVVVGADRIAANGDVANKIGTYSVAVLARHHNIPFYVAAPVSTIDFECSSGAHIPIEQRDISEVTHIGDKKIAADVDVLNPAFDITPNGLVSAIITEKGIIKAPYNKSIAKLRV